MKIAFASDHGGFDLKNALREYMASCGYDVFDLGTYTDESVDYPVFGHRCAEFVANGEADKGIICCGTGIGISIAANKVKGIRCALITSEETAELAAAHNHANMVSLGGRTTSFEDAVKYIEKWLATPEDTAERHARRVAMLDDM